MRKTPAWQLYGHCFAALWLLFHAQTSLAQNQVGAGELAPQFSSITLEKDCFGCAGGVKLVLLREGSATRTALGQARLGTIDQQRTSPLSSTDFDALLRVILEQDFLSLQSIYEEPDLRDGDWINITLAGPGVEKTVFQRAQAGPPALQAIAAAIAHLEAQLFKTAH
ncbi:hypothetical protein [Paucibacter sp. Y2R2-4]|uniref:hypothetical protein n=1 Tax=Paucibacter sp. Y2R2-4 TaxID=2893553 RepID=UPI0021E48655|nr:hypothetical protein [Paucibacter sp. Y2R2-4]MCV2351250.1 hypothetical protein [Paucibacter sp. Y2R2-4]